MDTRSATESQPPQEGLDAVTGRKTVTISNTVVNWDTKCRYASVVLHRSIHARQQASAQAERLKNALFKVCSAIVSEETNWCNASQVVD